MSGLLLLLTFNILVILGIVQTTATEMIFEQPADWLRERVTPWITKPLFDCVYCMSSFWGTIVYWVWMQDFTPDNLTIWPLYILALCGLSKLVMDNLVKF